VTILAGPPDGPLSTGGTVLPGVAPGPEDHPRRVAFDRQRVIELSASGVSAAALVWTPFHLLGLNAPFGFFVCWFTAYATIYGIVVRQRYGPIEFKDALATFMITAGLLVALLPLILLTTYVIGKGFATFKAGLPGFPLLTKDFAHFSTTSKITDGGFKAALIGSMEQVGVATIPAVVIGVLAATYINEIGGRFAGAVRMTADAMTGLPSIIAGLFVYSFWVLPRAPHGFSGLAASMALFVVMLPVVVRTAEEVLRLVAGSLREAALALGAPEWRMVLQVVIPTARTGLVTAALLGVARAFGETAPVILTAFGSPRTQWNLAAGPQDDLPFRIYTLVRSPGAQNVQIAWGGALLLMVVILTLFTLARVLGTGRPGVRRGGALLARLRRPTKA